MSVRSKAAPALRFVAPQLATLVDAAPAGDDWIFEIKYDGYRLQAIIDAGEVKLLTRRGNDWTARFPNLASRLQNIPVTSAILDGELVALDPSGKSAFNRLQNQLDAADDQTLTFFAFDLLSLNGNDLRDEPFRVRHKALSQLLRSARATTRGPVRLGQRMDGEAGALIQAACELGLEGIIGKRLDAPYQSGRNRNWVKVKCGHRQEFVVVGFTPPNRSRVGLGSLLLAVRDKNEFRYAGRVGSGFSDALLRHTIVELERLERKTSPLAVKPAGLPAGIRWVEPTVVVEVAFTEWTEDGLLRHPVFQGVREDKAATDVQREEATVARPTAKKSARKKSPDSGSDNIVEGVAITHPERVVFPESGITKLELAQHFARVAPVMLPHVANRPLSLVRCPEGSAHECFFQKHWTGKLPPAIDTVPILQSDGNKHAHVVIHDAAGLVTLAQWGVMEIHPWGSRADDPERPDRVIFDFDPGPGVGWGDIQEAASGARALLEALGLDSWLKTSGGKGLHVVVPIARRSTWDEASAFARGIAEHMQATLPDRFISKASKAARKGLIFVDWMRNTRGATAVAPWSTRARPSAGVSVPVPWAQLAKLTAGDQFTLQSVRANPPKKDPWAALLAEKQPLSRKILDRLKVI